jgi:hypothetical protein
MKQIKIIPKNENAINRMITDVEGKATCRCIDYGDLTDLINKAEGRLPLALLPKKDQIGTRVSWRMPLNLPNAYSARPGYTWAEILRRSTGWFVSLVERRAGFTNQTEKIEVTLPPQVAEEAISRFRATFAVAEDDAS